MAGCVITIVGAESTGKSTLALALCKALNAGAARRPRCAHVDETLRSFCIRTGRTPTRAEQVDIAAEQTRRIAAAAAAHEVVIADTSALMTAVYSDYVFGDTSLYDSALATQAGYDLTLLTALDLPWLADGLQRDGAHVRQPVDALIRQALQRADLGWSVIAGQGAARLANALAVIERLCAVRSARARPAQGRPIDTEMDSGGGSGSGGNDDTDDACGQSGWRHVCNRCGDGSCERRLLALQRHTRGD
jgi:nicotinamide riboside kinase